MRFLPTRGEGPRRGEVPMPEEVAAESGRGAAVEVKCKDGVWHGGRLVERLAGTVWYRGSLGSQMFCRS